jgi:Matrixin
MMGLLPQDTVASTFKPFESVQNSNVGNGRPDPEFAEFAEFAVILAQASAKAPVAPVPNWLSKRRSPEEYERAIKYAQTDQSGSIDYTAVGPRGLPVLKKDIYLERKWTESGIGLDTGTCYEIDLANKVAGSWGPDCVIEKFTKLPRNGLSLDKTSGLYIFKPSGRQVEEAQFILSNGAGRKAEVFVKFHLPRRSSDAGGDLIQLAAWQRSAQLSALIASAQQTLTGFTDLPATALGQTVGEGATAAITLDTNAAGHGWYIDPTPLDNSDDYLPTSDASVWQAKAGSEAAGKMDMLSVLLHEYGHALGLEHSGNGADFMAASLQPGVRKLPRNEELDLMSQLVAQLKAEQGAALTPALSQGERGQSPLQLFGHA